MGSRGRVPLPVMPGFRSLERHMVGQERGRQALGTWQALQGHAGGSNPQPVGPSGELAGMNTLARSGHPNP
jgi:hypothetical protein